MAWTDIPNGDIDADSPITTSLMAALRDNVPALADGDPGAPLIQQAAIDANVIGQSEIKRATASQSTVVSGQATGTISPTGGTYTMAYFLGGFSGPELFIADNNSGGYTAVVGIFNNEPGGSDTAFLYSLYIPASPPYDLGDGEIPLFIFLLIDDESGEIIGSEIAPDPFWAYHGPSNIAAKLIGNKGNIARVPEWMAENINIAEAMKSRTDRAKMIERLKNDPIVEIEATPEFKNTDMGARPHSWWDHDLTGKTVVLIDPVSDMVADLAEYKNALDRLPEPEPGSDIFSLIRDGYIKIGNQALKRSGPPGVQVVSAQWS